MSSRVVVLMLLLAACGDDGGDAFPDGPPVPDAPPDQTIDADTSGCTTVEEFGDARGLVFAGDGTLYFSRGTAIGRVRPCQEPEYPWVTVGVTALNSLMVDPPNHALYVSALNANMIYKIDLTVATPTSEPYAAVTGPEGLTLGPDGALWSTTSDSVVRIDAANSATVVIKTALNNPKGLAFRADGSLLVMEYSGQIFAFGIENNVESSHTVFAADNGAFGGIIGIALDAAGNVFITEGDGGPFMVVLDPTGAVIDTSEDGLGNQLDFGAGPIRHTDLYVGGAGLVPRTVAGAAVPWHAL